VGGGWCCPTAGCGWGNGWTKSTWSRPWSRCCPGLLCTEGGHWENLGLVELLRHRCRTVYCIDASGDAPPFATTLAEVITLAYEELGVRITLRDPSGLVPGSADPLAPPEVLERLNARLSRSAVCVADVEYPEAFKETAFPRQSTGDQFFDHTQFDAYRALGFHIGTVAVAAGGRPPASPGRGGQPRP
jgi:hypothetical protein